MDEKKKIGKQKRQKRKKEARERERERGEMELEKMAKKSVEISASLTDLKMSQQTMQLFVVVAVVCCTLLLLLLVTCLHTMHLVVVICLRCCCCCTSCLPAKADSATEKVQGRERGRQHDGDMTYFCICVAAPETATCTPLTPLQHCSFPLLTCSLFVSLNPLPPIVAAAVAVVVMLKLKELRCRLSFSPSSNVACFACNAH